MTEAAAARSNEGAASAATQTAASAPAAAAPAAAAVQTKPAPTVKPTFSFAGHIQHTNTQSALLAVAQPLRAQAMSVGSRSAPHLCSAHLSVSAPHLRPPAAILKGNSTPAPAPAPKIVARPTAAATAVTPAAATATKSNGKAAGKANAGRSAQAAAKPADAPKKEIPLVAGSLWAKKLEVPNGTMTIKPKPAPAAAAEPIAHTAAVTNAPAAAAVAADSSATGPLTTSVAPTTTESTTSSTTTPTPATSAANTVAPVTPATAATPASVPAPTPAAAPTAATPAASTTVPAAVTPATTPAATVTAPSSFAAALRSKQAPAAATAAAPAPVAAAAPSPAVAKQQPQQAAQTRAAKKKEAAAPATKSAAAKAASAANAPLLPVPTSSQQSQQQQQHSSKPSVSTNGSGASVSVASAASSKFSLVPVSDRIRIRDGATRDCASRPRRDYFSSSENAPVAVQVPAGYTACPLSPYPLFLLDTRTNVMTASLTALNNSTGQIEELANVSAECVPMVLVPSPVSGGGQLMPLLSLLATQLEYFFSVENLARDVYLRGLMDPSSGYVALSALLAFNRVQALTRSPLYLHLAAKHYCCASAIDAETGVATRTTRPLFKVKNGRVRVRSNWRRYVFPAPADSTAAAKRTAAGATEDDGESSEEEDEVAASPSPVAAAAAALDATKLQPPVDASVASTSDNTPVANSRADSPLTPTAATTSA